jgi:hypothetical protein
MTVAALRIAAVYIFFPVQPALTEGPLKPERSVTIITAIRREF